MTLEEIKKALEALGPTERSEVLAFLVRRRLLDDPSYRAEVDRRSADSDPNHWLKPEDFEQRLEDLLRADGSSKNWRHVSTIRLRYLGRGSGPADLLAQPRSQAEPSHETEHRQRS